MLQELPLVRGLVLVYECETRILYNLDEQNDASKGTERAPKLTGGERDTERKDGSLASSKAPWRLQRLHGVFAEPLLLYTLFVEPFFTQANYVPNCLFIFATGTAAVSK